MGQEDESEDQGVRAAIESRCVDLEERLGPILRCAWAKVAWRDLVSDPDKDREYIEVKKGHVETDSWWEWIWDRLPTGRYRRLDVAVQAQFQRPVDHPVYMTNLMACAKAGELRADGSFRIESLVGVMESFEAPMKVFLSIERVLEYQGILRSWRFLESLRYLPIFGEWESKSGVVQHDYARVDGFVSRLERIADRLQKEYFPKSEADRKTVPDGIQDEVQMSLRSPVLVKEPTCPYCAVNGDAEVPVVRLEGCGHAYHEDCLVKLSELTKEGVYLAHCGIFGCDSRIALPSEMIEFYTKKK